MADASGCHVPLRYKHLKWHVIRGNLLGEPEPKSRFYERAEWVNDPENGPAEGGHWVRWGYCGNFPSLCQADYVGPAIDQDSSYAPIDERLIDTKTDADFSALTAPPSPEKARS